jgi:ribosomal protein L12E/L44/L45/RPP1/RPP2
MPYQNVPDDLQEQMESCVQHVMEAGHDNESAIAICYTSVVEGKNLEEVIKTRQADQSAKAGARNSSQDRARLRQMRQLANQILALTIEMEPDDEDKPRPAPETWEIKNALKTISKTDDELRVANYIVLFGGRDLEGIASPRKNADGSVGEFFTAATTLESEYTKTGVLYVDWEHGAGKHLDGNAAPSGDDVLGVVDWKSASIDELGVWVERVLNRRSKYVRYLETLIEAGLIGNSSQAIPDQVRKKASGEIENWPLMRDTLTVSPMEPRMMTENVVSALKSLGIYQDEPSMETPAAEPAASDDVPKPDLISIRITKEV